MEFYVDNTLGDDGNPGSLRLPWQTLAKVNDTIFFPGDSVLFKRGEVWAEELNCYQSTGEKSEPITFGSYGNGAMPVIEGRVFIDGFRGIKNAYIVIDGLEVRNITSRVRGIWLLDVGPGCVVRNCVVHDISGNEAGEEGRGIDFDGYPGSIEAPLVENNRIYNIAGYGIQFENCFAGAVARNNVISDCETGGLTVIAYPEHDRGDGVIVPSMRGLLMDGKIENNLIYGCDNGISVFNTAGWEFTHNTIADGIGDETGLLLWYEDRAYMTGLTWNHNTITNCNQIMFSKHDYDLLEEHDFNCYEGGAFCRWEPNESWSFNEFREGTGQEKHSVETSLAIGAYEHTG